jgi:uncharacterized glyoxalase superfamily protein PhnB
MDTGTVPEGRAGQGRKGLSWTTEPSKFAIGHIVKSKQEVDALMKQAEKAGARITDPPHDRFWGGDSGYFQDLDGHLWEIAWNPEWEVKE